jgi:hypothetical protein
MESIFSLLLNNQEYLILLATVMGLSFIAKKNNVFVPVYEFLSRNIKSKRAVVALTSAISGVLPINGRVVVSAGILDTLAPKNKKREKFGIVDYLATHHYYFWSPLEKTVILPVAVLGITYTQFLGRVAPLLIAALIFIMFYIFSVLKEEDIELSITRKKTSVEEDKQQFVSYAKTLAVVALIIVLGNVISKYSDFIVSFVEATRQDGLLIVALIAGFLGSLALGSSSKFGGFTAIAVSIFGIEYLPLFFAVDYAGYILSPMHKCLAIGKSYFGTPIKKYYSVLASYAGLIVLVGVVSFLTVDK